MKNRPRRRSILIHINIMVIIHISSHALHTSLSRTRTSAIDGGEGRIFKLDNNAGRKKCSA